MGFLIRNNWTAPRPDRQYRPRNSTPGLAQHGWTRRFMMVMLCKYTLRVINNSVIDYFFIVRVQLFSNPPSSHTLALNSLAMSCGV